MSISKVIEAIERDSFSRIMNSPEDGFGGQADIKMLPDESRWAVCPWCGKKAVKIMPKTKIFELLFKCRNNKCKKEFMINI
jgi:hypothetical protein